MNCEACQKRLLAADAPESPSADVQAHLAECPACIRWQRWLVRIERHVPLLPVPPTAARPRLLGQILGAPAPAPAAAPPPSIPLPARPWWRRPLALRLGGAAAAVLLIGCGVLLGLALMRRDHAPDVPKPDQDPVARRQEPDQDLVARLVDCNALLAEADTPKQRVEALADMADALRREGQALRRADTNGNELDEVARLYAKVVREGVVSRARELPPEKRAEVLRPIATRLAQAEREARQLAGQDKAAAAPLLQIAEAARDGDRELRELMMEATE